MFGPPWITEAPDDGLEDYPDHLGNLSDMELSVELANAKEYGASPKVNNLILKEMGERVAAEIERQNREYEQEYEYGYTVTCGTETREVVLGTCGEDRKAHYERQVGTANLVERGPNVRGLVSTPRTVHWFRKRR